MYQKVADTLNELGITFHIVEHEPALTNSLLTLTESS